MNFIDLRKLKRVLESFQFTFYTRSRAWSSNAMGSSTLCSECGITFSNNNYLRIHIQTIHEGAREHECNECRKKFSVKFSLLRHMRQIHTKVKPYSCQFCPLKFSDWTTKIRHERIHTKIRPYKCSTCLKCFSYANVLKAHLKSHSNEPKFICAFCDKAFTLKFNLEAHLKRKHLQQRPPMVKAKLTKETKLLGPLFIDTETPHVFKCTMMPQFPMFPHVQILNLPSFCFQNPKPLKVIIANM